MITTTQPSRPAMSKYIFAATCLLCAAGRVSPTAQRSATPTASDNLPWSPISVPFTSTQRSVAARRSYQQLQQPQPPVQVVQLKRSRSMKWVGVGTPPAHYSVPTPPIKHPWRFEPGATSPTRFWPHILRALHQNSRITGGGGGSRRSSLAGGLTLPEGQNRERQQPTASSPTTQISTRKSTGAQSATPSPLQNHQPEGVGPTLAALPLIPQSAKQSVAYIEPPTASVAAVGLAARTGVLHSLRTDPLVYHHHNIQPRPEYSHQSSREDRQYQHLGTGGTQRHDTEPPAYQRLWTWPLQTGGFVTNMISRFFGGAKKERRQRPQQSPYPTQWRPHNRHSTAPPVLQAAPTTLRAAPSVGHQHITPLPAASGQNHHSQFRPTYKNQLQSDYFTGTIGEKFQSSDAIFIENTPNSLTNIQNPWQNKRDQNAADNNWVAAVEDHTIPPVIKSDNVSNKPKLNTSLLKVITDPNIKQETAQTDLTTWQSLNVSSEPVSADNRQNKSSQTTQANTMGNQEKVSSAQKRNYPTETVAYKDALDLFSKKQRDQKRKTTLYNLPTATQTSNNEKISKHQNNSERWLKSPQHQEQRKDGTVVVTGALLQGPIEDIVDKLLRQVSETTVDVEAPAISQLLQRRQLSVSESRPRLRQPPYQHAAMKLYQLLNDRHSR